MSVGRYVDRGEGFRTVAIITLVEADIQGVSDKNVLASNEGAGVIALELIRAVVTCRQIDFDGAAQLVADLGSLRSHCDRVGSEQCFDRVSDVTAHLDAERNFLGCEWRSRCCCHLGIDGGQPLWRERFITWRRGQNLPCNNEQRGESGQHSNGSSHTRAVGTCNDDMSHSAQFHKLRRRRRIVSTVSHTA